MLCKALSFLTQACRILLLCTVTTQATISTQDFNCKPTSIAYISVDSVTSLFFVHPIKRFIWLPMTFCSGVFRLAHGCVQGLLQRLASATQPFNFRVLSNNTAAARHIAEATVNTGTYEQLLRAAVAAIVRPSSRSSQPLCSAVVSVLWLQTY